MARRRNKIDDDSEHEDYDKYTDTNSNNTVDDRLRRFDLGCSFCPPNGGENKKNHSKHGKGKAKYKTKRKGR